MIVGGIAMLAGSVLGGVVAQLTDLGVPFLLRAGILALMLVVAFFAMRDIGFTPDKSEGAAQGGAHGLPGFDRSTGSAIRRCDI